MLLLKNGNLHIGDGRILPACDILIAEGKIQAIAPGLTAESAEVIDASGHEVFPGFIDPAAAIGASGLPTTQQDNDEHSDPVTPQMNIRYAVDPDELDAQAYYKSGITTVGLAPTHNNVFGGQIAVCKTAPGRLRERIVKEHAGLKCSVTAHVKKTYGGDHPRLRTKMGIFALWAETLRAARATAPAERSASQQALCAAFDELQMPVFAAAGSQNEVDGLLHIMRDERATLYLVDGYCFASALPQMIQQHVGLVLGNVNDYSQVTKHDIDLTKLVDLAAQGNLIAFTTSNGGLPSGRETLLWNAIEAYRAGVAAEDVVTMLTLNPARMLGVEQRLGSLEVGKDADISVYTGHPVTSYAARVAHSIIDGKVVF